MDPTRIHFLGFRCFLQLRVNIGSVLLRKIVAVIFFLARDKRGLGVSSLSAKEEIMYGRYFAMYWLNLCGRTRPCVFIIS